MGPGAPARNPYGQASGKRKAESPAINARSDTFLQKRAKVHIARSIPAQPADAALKDGELDLQAFVAAHEFEIRSLEQSMATSKAVNNRRAFQQVPRGLRRRTASHNPKRVPKRLRVRAKREMAEDNTPVVEARRRKPRTSRGRIRAETAKRLGVLAARKRRRKLEQAGENGADGKGEQGLAVVGRTPRPKIRRNQLNEPPTPKSRFRKRQINKTWLPTHTWHAKRARMTCPKNPLWRFAVPLTPNEKIYRSTHRAQGDRGVVVWDMSYMSTIGLYGNFVGIERVLKRIGVVEESCWNEKGKKWRIGSRLWQGLLSREKDGDARLIGPSTVLWNPEPSTKDTSQDPKKTQRQIFFRVHPSAFLELFNELLRLTKMENPRLYIEDLRFEIGSIELTGPASTETLLAVLSPYPNKNKTKNHHAELFQSLNGLSNPASLPRGAVLSFATQDPRLRYPPRRIEAPDDAQAQMDLLEKIAAWPAEDSLEPYAIFDRDTRHKASNLPSQQSLNRRRTKNTPGIPLKLTASDPPIPITLLSTRAGSGTQIQGTWTLLAPWKCIQPIWYNIVHYPLTSGGNPRFAGLDEARQVAFERSLPWFPADYPETDAGAQWELEERLKRRKAWEKRPKSKRVEWMSLDLGAGRKGEVGDGLACDFELLFGLEKTQAELESTDAKSESMDIACEDSVPRAKKGEPISSLHRLSYVSNDTFTKLISPTTTTLPSANAIITVRLSLLSRGAVTSCARIYRLPSPLTTAPPSSEAEVPSTIPPEAETSSSSLPNDLRAQWLARVPVSTSSRGKSSKTKSSRPRDLEARKRLLAKELTSQPTPYPSPPPHQSDIDGHPLVPNADDLIGFVTTGSYSLSEGHGIGIGCLALDKAVSGVRESAKEGRLCIVRNAGENVGRIARWEAI